MPSAIVTGCAGFIGSHLVETLLKKNWHVTGIDNFHPYYAKEIKEMNLLNFKKNPNFDFIEGSILSEKDLNKLPDNVNYIFHFAAMAGVRNSIKHPKEYFEINVNGTLKLLKKFKNVDKFIFASSSSVYGDPSSDDFPINENHALAPISPYAESKLQAEKLCLEYAKSFKSKIVILRFYTVYGPRQRPDEAITKFIRLAQRGKPIPIFGDGNKERDFTFVSDIVNGAILAAQNAEGIFNLGTGSPVTVNQMISTIEKSMNKKIQKNHLASPIGDVQKTHADISRAKKEFGYEPQFNLDIGIDQSVKWCNETTNLTDCSIVNDD